MEPTLWETTSDYPTYKERLRGIEGEENIILPLILPLKVPPKSHLEGEMLVKSHLRETNSDLQVPSGLL